MKFKKVLLLVAVAALLTGCGCSNSARRSSKSDNPQPISENPVNPSQQPDSREPEIPISNPPIEYSSNIPDSHDVPPASSEQHGSSNGGGQQSSSHGQNSSNQPSSNSQAPSSNVPAGTYTITWKNYDGSVLEIDNNVPQGTTPTYDGATPRRPCDPNYAAKYFIFSGWTPTVVPAVADATYTATFTESSTPAHIYRITWKNYDGTTFYTATCGEGATPEYAGDTPRKPSSGGKYYAFNGWDPTPVPAYSDATYTATFIETDPPEPAVWPTAAVNAAITAWGALENSFPPFADERITSFTTSLNGAGDTLKIACNGMSLNEGKSAFPSYASSKLGSFTPDTTLVNGQTVYIDPTNHFYIGYDNNYPSIFRLMAVKYTPPVVEARNIIWQNYDGTVLETDTDVPGDATPEYNGATPTRPNSTDYCYYFNGWEASVDANNGDLIYTAKYYETIFRMVKPTSTSWRCNGLVNPFYSGEAIIPANFYDGYPVTSIYVGAFNSCSNVTKLSVPNTVTEIEITPFAGMASLQELEIPFIGRSIDATDGDATLAYLFGTGEFTGGTYTTQYYSSSGHISSYIPDALHKVIVNGGVISRGAFYDCTHITDVVLNEGVTKIKDYAFDCSSITSIVVPSTVTRIGHYAFNHCADLVSFYATDDKANNRVLELGTNILQYCTALQNVSAPIYGYFGNLFGQEEYEGLTAVTTSDNVTYYIPSTLQSVTVTGGSLMKGAFEKSWLTTIGITEDVYYITPGALAGLEYLENLTIPYVGVTPDATEINVNTQFGAIFGRENWASGKTYAAAAFTGISGSSNITYYLPKTLKNVTITGNYPVFRAGFDHCEYIETITFTEGLSVVPEYFFRECKAATAIDIGTNVTDINNYAFEHCEALLEAPLYEGLEHLGRYAFGYCNALTSITIPSTITEFSRSGEGGGYQFFKCASLTTVTMLCSITDTYMFKMCPVLTTVTMSPNIALYKQNMFEQSGLTTFTVPEGVTNLDAYVFEQCESLTTVNLPVSLKKIGGSCFNGCTALATINYAGTTAQWASVTKNTSWAKNVIATFVTCSDGIAYI